MAACLLRQSAIVYCLKCLLLLSKGDTANQIRHKFRDVKGVHPTVDLSSPIYLLFDQEEASATPPILVNTSKIIGGRFDTNIKPNLLTVAPLSVHQQQPPLLSTVDLSSPIYLLFDQEEASATPPILVNTSKIVGGRFEHLGGAPSVSQKVR